MTLTTVDPHHDLERFRRDVEQVFKVVRLVVGGEVQYLGMMEWTTGESRRSGGYRRVHEHLLLRGVDAAAAAEVEARVRRVWERRTGANRVEVRELRNASGATAYVVAHHHKREQAPPPGVSVRRLRHSRSPAYFADGVTALREEVRRIESAKRLQRATRRLVDWDYLNGAPDEVVDQELAAALGDARREREQVRFVKLDRAGAYRLDTARPIKVA
jgi:hypothetical protein